HAELLGRMRGGRTAADLGVPAELGRDDDVVRAGAYRVCEKLVRNVGAVVPSGVEDSDAELESSAQDTAGPGQIRRRTEDAGAGQAHGAVAQAAHERPIEFDEAGTGHGRVRHSRRTH